MLRFATITGMLLAMLLTACSDDDDKTPTVAPASIQQVELARMNSFYDIEVPRGGNWQVVATPQWATPMQNDGADGDAIDLFVETNDDESDRTDTLTVNVANSIVVKYVLTQHGILSDDDNGVIVSARDLTKTYGVGYGMDVFEAPSSTQKYNVKTQMAINPSKLINELKNMGEQDALYNEKRYSSRTESVTGNSTTAMANQLSINAGIEVGISAFTFGVKGGYESTGESKKKYAYAIEEVEHIVGSQYLRPGMLRYFAQQQNSNVFQSTFWSLAQKLKSNPNDVETMRSLVKKYGTHVITHGVVGGELKLSMRMEVDSLASSSDIHAALNLSAKVVDVRGEFSMTNKEKSISDNTTISLRSYGGNNVYTIAPGTAFTDFQQQVKSQVKVDQWVKSIKDETSLALIDVELTPLYDLMLSDEARNSLRTYIIRDYQKEMLYPDDASYHPSLYRVNIGGNGTQGSLYLSDIDVQIDIERRLIPTISDIEPLTVIYAGEEGNVGRTHGFFIGSTTRRPFKFTLNDDGSYSINEFTALPMQAITTVYVDTSGDLTISPKAPAELYTDVSLMLK